MGAILSIGSILPIGLVYSGTREKWPLLYPTRYALMRRCGQQMPWTGSRSNADIVTKVGRSGFYFQLGREFHVTLGGSINFLGPHIPHLYILWNLDSTLFGFSSSSLILIFFISFKLPNLIFKCTLT